jgi:hypothetical protein
VLDREVLADHAAERGADDVRALDPALVEHLDGEFELLTDWQPSGLDIVRT